MNELPTYPRRTTTRRAQRLDQGAVVTADVTSPPVALNQTALALWELCDGRTTAAEMVAAVSELFALDMVRARADVEAALRRMLSTGVIR